MNYRQAIFWATLVTGIFIWAGLLGFLGHLLDSYLEISPWGFVVGLSLGMATGLLSFILQVHKYTK